MSEGRMSKWLSTGQSELGGGQAGSRGPASVAFGLGMGAGTGAAVPGPLKEQRVAETGTSIRALPESTTPTQAWLSITWPFLAAREPRLPNTRTAEPFWGVGSRQAFRV